jgi:hypothetical protein
VTPELVVEASVGTFSGFGRPIYPIGQGDSSPEKWRRFIATAMNYGIGSVSLWRYGVSNRAAFDVMRESLPKPAPAAEAPPAPQAAAEAPAPAPAQAPEVIQAPEAPPPPVEAAVVQPPEVTSSHAPPTTDGQQSEPAGSAEIPAGPPATTDAALPQPASPTSVEAESLLRMQQTIDEIKERVISRLGRGFLDFFR